MSTTTSTSHTNASESLWETHPVTPDRFEDFGGGDRQLAMRRDLT